MRSLGRNVEINRCQIGNFPFMKRLEGIMKAARYRELILSGLNIECALN